MAVYISRRGNQFFRSRTLAVAFSKFNCTLAEGEMKKCSTIRPATNEDISSVDTSKWKKIHASAAGIRDSIPEPSWIVLKLLKSKGHDAYLVGGCVRDLILNRVPKDFDVITTANLKQIKKLFHRSQVVGKRFPICHVWMKESLIEVSSFDTVAKSDSGKVEEKNCAHANLFEMPCGWGVKDRNLWKNSMHRDFTINSLFFDPSEWKVYDYTNGIEDLKDLKLRTVVPAHLSFKEDSARVLRGLRIAARLSLSFSKDIETAIPEFVSSIAKLDPVRLMMEVNYMLSYGAAGPSILLLMKFKLLHVLLPFQAAYLDQASKTSPMRSLLLVRLFSNMDNLVFCNKPADRRLWISILAFHIALVRNPQDAIVVCAFASLLYHGNWREALKFAREHENSVPRFAPEISESLLKKSDKDLAEAVSRFTSLLQDTLHVLTEMEDLREALYLYPNFKSSGRVFISKIKGKEVAELFARLTDTESYESEKQGFSIDYQSLGSGKTCEIRFVLGKIILDTMTEEVTTQKASVSGPDHRVAAANNEKKHKSVFSKSKNEEKPRHGSKTSSIPMAKQKNLKRTREEDEHTINLVTEMSPDLNLSSAAQSAVRKPSRHGKEAPAPEPLSKQKTSKNSKSYEQKNKQETEMCLDLTVSGAPENQHQSVKETQVTKPVKQKSSKKFRLDDWKNSKETAASLDTTLASSTKHSVFNDKSMKDLLNFIEKSNQKPGGKEEKKAVSVEKTKRPGKLSSLFK